MPHSYGSSFTLLYFSECSRLDEDQREQREPGRDDDKDSDRNVG